MRQEPGYAGQITGAHRTPAHSAALVPVPPDLHPSVQAILTGLGIGALWTHQAEALQRALGGENVAIVSGTASGKTLCYTLPIAQDLYQRPTRRALLIYPTKALAQDQLRRLEDFGAGAAFIAATYDGDTPPSRRRRIKREAQVVLTNPDMLHVGILPYHQTWAEFFRNLRFIVLDEVHSYRGVFGSHTAQVLRRLRRICRHYGSDPRFISCSATIANPRELSEALTGLPFSLVDHDGSPQGPRTFCLWDPPLVESGPSRRRSTNLEAAELMVRLMRQGVRTICFTLARRQAELILTYVRKALEGTALASRVMAYRGGYLPAERRRIEADLFSGELMGVVSTTALEVGVDIGGLDAAILAGYPGSVASTWQQVGRAGRGTDEALGVLMSLQGGISRYLNAHPEYLLDRASERAIVDPSNRYILAGHLLCAAFELALTEADGVLFGPLMEPILEVLAEHRYVIKRTAWHWVDPDVYPAADISIRSVSGAGYDIVVRGPGGQERKLGTMDDAGAFRMIHPGAIYLHAGESYVVDELDLERRVALVHPESVDYYTVALTSGDLRTGPVRERRELPTGTAVACAEVHVRSQVTSYRKRRQVTEQDLGVLPLDLPPAEFDTVGVWIALGPADVEFLQAAGHDLMGSIHALEHALIGLLPLFALCDPHDIGGISAGAHPDLEGAPTVCVYDGYPGGVGICEAAYERLGELLRAVAEALAACPCEEGCPSCVQSPQCGDNNQPLDKEGARRLADRLAGETPAANGS